MTEEDPPQKPPRTDGVRRVGRILDDAWRKAVEDRLDALDRRIDARPGGDVDLADEVAQLKDALDVLIADRQKAPPPFHWDDLKPAQREARWHELEVWIAEVLERYHPAEAKALRPCWREHPSARVAVTACWLAWIGAYRATGRRGHDPADWLARHLPALGTQLRTELKTDPAPCPQHPPEEDHNDPAP